MQIEFGKYAGLIAIHFGYKKRFTLHLGVKYAHWMLGYQEDWYDGPLYFFGGGPFFLLSWLDKESHFLL